jgi:hypothetical protein
LSQFRTQVTSRQFKLPLHGTSEFKLIQDVESPNSSMDNKALHCISEESLSSRRWIQRYPFLAYCPGDQWVGCKRGALQQRDQLISP